MPRVYVLRGSAGRYYIGSTENLERRLAEHRRGSNHTTRRLGETLELIAAVEVTTMKEARKLERICKRKKNPELALDMLRRLGVKP